MAKTHSGHGVFFSRRSHRGTRPKSRCMVNKVIAHKACHGWKDLVLRAYQRKKNYSANKSHHSCLEKRKQMLVCDLDSSVSSLIQETGSGIVRPLSMDAIATAIIPRNITATKTKDEIIAITATISSLGPKPNEPGSLSKALCTLKNILPNRSTAFKQIFSPALRLSLSTFGSAPDNIRGSHRFHLGFADHPCNEAKGFNGLPREPDGAKAWYPRIHHEHVKEGAFSFLSNVLPIITACFTLCDVVKPGFTKTLEDLCQPLVFPFEVSLQDDFSLKTNLKEKNRECQRFFSRMTVSTVAGQNIISNIKPSKRSKKKVVSKGCNNFISTLVHKDVNDVGKGGILHSKHSPTRYEDNGRVIVSGDGNQEILQLVIAISHKCHTSEGLAVLPNEAGDEVFILKPPPIVDSIEEEVRLQIYALDYSHRLHANVHPTKELHPDAWCVRITCYTTVHAATWSKYITTLSTTSASSVLSSLYQLPGFTPLPYNVTL
jgi:hypothetical protein